MISNTFAASAQLPGLCQTGTPCIVFAGMEELMLVCL